MLRNSFLSNSAQCSSINRQTDRQHVCRNKLW